eukprot:5653654-Karenia_brevis.AAC.1
MQTPYPATPPGVWFPSLINSADTIPKIMIGAFHQLLPHIGPENAVFAFSLLLQSLCAVVDVSCNSQYVNSDWVHSANHASPVHFDKCDPVHINV